MTATHHAHRNSFPSAARGESSTTVPRAAHPEATGAASANDGIIPAVHTEALWEHFGRPEVYWSCGGHILYFDKGRVTDRALRFLKEIEVID